MAGTRLKIAAIGAACVACCAPLVVPLVMPLLVWSGLAGAGAAGGGLMAGISWEMAIGASLLVAAAIAAGVVWSMRRRRAATLAEGASCDLQTCGPDNALKLPAR